jgi:hypothetical protein
MRSAHAVARAEPAREERRPPPPPEHAPPQRPQDVVVRLQAAAGNQAVARALKAKGPTLSRWFGLVPPAYFPKPPVSEAEMAWIESLTPYVRDQIDTEKFSETAEGKRIGALEAEKTKAEKGKSADDVSKIEGEYKGKEAAEHERMADQRTENRTEFVLNMRKLLGPDPKTEKHFKSIRLAAVPGQVWLAGEAATALEHVRNDLQKPPLEHDLPSTTVAQSLRGRHLGKMPDRGMMGHPLGFSIDYHAYQNPKIKDAHRRDLLNLLTGGHTHIALKGAKNEEFGYGERRKIVEEAEAVTEAGGDPMKDPRFKSYLDQFDKQFDDLGKASTDFKASLPAENLTKLRGLKDRYVEAIPALKEVDGQLAAIAKQLAAARKKSKSGDDDAKVKELLAAKAPLDERKAKLEAEKAEIAAGLSDVFKPWIDKIDAQEKPVRDRAKKEGVELDKLPAEAELKKAENDLKKIVTRQGYEEKYPKSKKRASWDAEILALEKELAPLLAKVDEAMPDLAASRKAEPTAAERLQQIDALRAWNKEKSVVAGLEGIKSDLGGNLEFVFGGVEAVKDKRGNVIRHRLALEPLDPSISQLLGVADDPGRREDEGGFFNPEAPEVKDGFNKLFFETMIRHGFDPGVAWRPGSTDPMHFDYVHGFSKLV